MRETTQEKFLEEEAKPVAIKRLERSLILDQLAQEEKVEVDKGSLQNEFGQTLNALQGQGINLNQVRGGKRGQQQVAEAIAMESASRLITRRTLERMKAIATGEYKPEQPEAEMKPEQAVAEQGSGEDADMSVEGKKKPKKKASTKSPGKKSKSAGEKPETEKTETE
jgi:FKBP-type peptidyl-prolyl cis-trans isomerase (trigger factor)